MSQPTKSNIADPDPNITKVLTYWFDTCSTEHWFAPAEEVGKSMDDHIRSNFGDLVEKARETNELDEIWTQTPRGTMALIILLDQFPRNIYRGSGLSFAADIKAQRITTAAIAKGFDKQAASEPGGTKFHSMFYYLPLMHAENLISQIACVALLENLALDCQANGTEDEKSFISKENSVGFAERHLKCISAVGRFPSRNEWLGREMREDEKKWLEEHPQGF